MSFSRIFFILTVLIVGNSARAKTTTLVDAVKAKAEEMLTATPKDLEVCFSPEEACDIKLWKFIQSAQKTIDIAIYDITHPKIVHEILVASKKIPVRVIVDRRQSKGEHSLVSTLIKAGAQVRYGRQRGVMHNKFTIVDGTMLETGSFNYSFNASERNSENQIYLSNSAVVQRYIKRFQDMWQEATPASGPSSNRGQESPSQSR